MVVLSIDIGNTSTAIARYQHGRVRCVSHLEGGIRHQPAACEASVGAVLDEGPVDGVMVGSVVPPVNAAWKRLLRRFGLPLTLLRHDMRLPVTLDYPNPETTGADRIANVAGAVVKYGTPVMVVDIGTAVTYDLVSEDRRFFTGVIAPGPAMMARALHHYTALLPEISLAGRCPAVPRDTVGAMRLGVEVGYRGSIRETVAYLRPLLGGSPRLVATGGYGRRFALPLKMGFVVDPNLTLFGLGWLREHQES